MNIKELEEKCILAREAMHDFLQKMGEKYQGTDGIVLMDEMDEDDQATWTFHSIALTNASRAFWRAQMEQMMRPPSAQSDDDSDFTWLN